MAVSEDPTVATEVAQFGEGANPAASIRYDVPLPGAYSFQRIVPLEVQDNWFTETATEAGTSLAALGVLKEQDGKVQSVDGTRLLAFYQRMLPVTVRPSLRVAAGVGVDVQALTQPVGGGGSDPAPALRRDGPADLDREDVEIQRRRREDYLDKLAQRQQQDVQVQADAGHPPATIQVPAPTLGQGAQQVDYSIASAGVPKIAIVETWQVSAFLGDYGLGRTLQTFTLLPGERTTITVETWRTDSATREDASSVFDSSDTAAQTRFSSALTNQSGSAFQEQGGWAISVGTKYSASGSLFGIVQLASSVEGGFSANHQEARQRFSTSVSQTSQEHASQVNASRRQAVQSSSSATTDTGTSQTTVREIANTNLRRVLNFVFRELNQTYETITSLRGVAVAFYNGNVGSAEIVALADLRRLLEKYVVAEHRDELARAILAMVTQCLDHQGTPQTMLQVGTRAAGHYDWLDATLKNDGTLDFNDSPLAPQYSWRIKPGPIGQPDEPHKVAGVVTAKDSVVLRTDNVIVEALLGQADALDPYASALQALDLQSRQADLEWRKAETRRTTEALNLVSTRPEKDKVDAFDKMLGDKPDIEVVPVASVNDGNR